MKNFFTGSITLLTFFLTPADFVFAGETHLVGTVAKVVALQGDAFVSVGKSEKKKLKLGDLVPEHALIITQQNTAVSLLLNDQSEVKVGASTTFEMNFPEKEPNHIELNLHEGILKSIVKKRTDSDRFFRIKTHAATMGVRGTEFVTSVTIDQAKEFHEQLMVLSGSVQVSDHSGHELALVKDGMALGFTSYSGPKGPMIRENAFQPSALTKDQKEEIRNDRFLNRRGEQNHNVQRPGHQQGPKPGNGPVGAPGTAPGGMMPGNAPGGAPGANAPGNLSGGAPGGGSGKAPSGAFGMPPSAPGQGPGVGPGQGTGPGSGPGAPMLPGAPGQMLPSGGPMRAPPPGGLPPLPGGTH